MLHKPVFLPLTDEEVDAGKAKDDGEHHLYRGGRNKASVMTSFARQRVLGKRRLASLIPQCRDDARHHLLFA
jgi:hypothetical protein